MLGWQCSLRIENKNGEHLLSWEGGLGYSFNSFIKDLDVVSRGNGYPYVYILRKPELKIAIESMIKSFGASSGVYVYEKVGTTFKRVPPNFQEVLDRLEGLNDDVEFYVEEWDQS